MKLKKTCNILIHNRVLYQSLIVFSTGLFWYSS